MDTMDIIGILMCTFLVCAFITVKAETIQKQNVEIIQLLKDNK